MPATVVHHRDRHLYLNYVYCGRPSKWGNPHQVGRCSCGKVHSRAEAIHLFNVFWNSDDGAMLRVAALQELADKTCGCWCAPKPCHVQIIVDYVNQYARALQT
jgi:hypothetical protein